MKTPNHITSTKCQYKNEIFEKIKGFNEIFVLLK